MKHLALIVAVLLLTQTRSGYAQSIAAQSEELNRIHSKLQDATQNIEQLRVEREKLLSQLQTIELQYGAAAGSLRDLGLQIGGKKRRLKHLNTQMRKLQAELKMQKEELSKQIKASFVMGKKEPLRLLLNQQDPALASRMLVYYDYLNKNRLNRLTTLKNNIALLNKLEQEKHQENDSLDQAVRSQKSVQLSLSYTKKQRDALLLRLNQEFKAKTQQLAQLDNSFSASQALIAKLEQEAAQYEIAQPEVKTAPQPQNSIDNLDANGNPVNSDTLPDDAKAFATAESKHFTELKGHLPWPVKGAMIKKFGSSGVESHGDGVVIAAKEGTGIRAVSSGRVVFSNWLRGYGLIIIIDHGKGYMSLYGFNQSLYKKAGDYVKAGTVIAAVGKSGGRNEAELYFGIRNKGKSVNPALWCKKG
jgi:septal ring factor EnvC (AmiA/AmiB activator)